MTIKNGIEYKTWTWGDTGWAVFNGVLAGINIAAVVVLYGRPTVWLNVFAALFIIVCGVFTVQSGRRRRYNQAVWDEIDTSIGKAVLAGWPALDVDAIVAEQQGLLDKIDYRIFSFLNPGYKL